MIYLIDASKGIVGISIVIGTFLFTLLVHRLLGGDKGQAKRSDWFPLWYIVPIMVALALFFILMNR